jgi:peroxiredoxin
VLELTFDLLSDWNGEAVEAFGVAHEFAGMRGVAQRTAFLVDGDGTVRAAWRYGSDEVPDVDALLEAARAL